MATLKRGILAFYDSFAGLVPVKVLAVTAPEEDPAFDLGFGEARTSVRVQCQVTEPHGPYKKDEVLNSNAMMVVPRTAILRRQYSTVIAAYAVEPDQVTAA